VIWMANEVDDLIYKVSTKITNEPYLVVLTGSILREVYNDLYSKHAQKLTDWEIYENAIRLFKKSVKIFL
jgi:hypothetical protein